MKRQSRVTCFSRICFETGLQTLKSSIELMLSKAKELGVGDSIRMTEFQSYKEMRDFDSMIKERISQSDVYQKAMSRKNLTYEIRRAV